VTERLKADGARGAGGGGQGTEGEAGGAGSTFIHKTKAESDKERIVGGTRTITGSGQRARRRRRRERGISVARFSHSRSPLLGHDITLLDKTRFFSQQA